MSDPNMPQPLAWYQDPSNTSVDRRNNWALGFGLTPEDVGKNTPMSYKLEQASLDAKPLGMDWRPSFYMNRVLSTFYKRVPEFANKGTLEWRLATTKNLIWYKTGVVRRRVNEAKKKKKGNRFEASSEQDSDSEREDSRTRRKRRTKACNTRRKKRFARETRIEPSPEEEMDPESEASYTQRQITPPHGPLSAPTVLPSIETSLHPAQHMHQHQASQSVRHIVVSAYTMPYSQVIDASLVLVDGQETPSFDKFAKQVLAKSGLPDRRVKRYIARLRSDPMNEDYSVILDGDASLALAFEEAAPHGRLRVELLAAPTANRHSRSHSRSLSVRIIEQPKGFGRGEDDGFRQLPGPPSRY